MYCNCRDARDDVRGGVHDDVPPRADPGASCYDVVMANDDAGDGRAQKPTQKLSQDLAAKALLSAGRDAARAALEGLTLSDDEKAARAAARSRATKKKLVLGVVVATIGAIGVIALFQLIASLWLWAIGAVVVAGTMGVAALLLKPRIDALRARLGAGRAARAAEQAARDAAAQRQHALVAAEQAKAQEAKKLDDELARLKQQAGR